MGQWATRMALLTWKMWARSLERRQTSEKALTAWTFSHRMSLQFFWTLGADSAVGAASAVAGPDGPSSVPQGSVLPVIGT